MDKLVAEFRYLQANATGTLSKFMDYLTYAYMIDNVALLITGTLHERDTRELLERCHPLGWFETMPVLCVATNIEELYNSVLIETPLAPYFKGSLSHQDLDELNIEIIRNTLYKNYLEDFHRFVNEEPGIKGTPTASVMSEILEFEADRRSINITLNSFGTELSKQDRKKLYPDFGRLHPEGTLMLSRADDPEGVRIAVDGVYDYRTMMDQTGMGGGGGGLGNQSGGIGGDEGKSLEDLFYKKEMEISKLAFTYQFTHAVVYAWVKLKEQVSDEMYVSLSLLRANAVCRRSGISRGLPSALPRARRIGLGIISACFDRFGVTTAVYNQDTIFARLTASLKHIMSAHSPVGSRLI
jgi:V-type H+-transporting ATPase subunit d